MSIELLEAAADGLGELLNEVVFVGGATVGLWITDPAAPAPRPTKDVDSSAQDFAEPRVAMRPRPASSGPTPNRARR